MHLVPVTPLPADASTDFEVFKEHETYFVSKPQNPGQLILGFGPVLSDALEMAIEAYKD